MPMGVNLFLGIGGGGVGGGAINPFHAKAQALLAAIASAPTIGDVAGNDVPTITQGSGFGSSSLTGASFGSATNVTALPVDARIAAIGATLLTTTSPYAQTDWNKNSSPLIGGGSGWGVKFQIDATAFDVGVYGIGTQSRIRAKVNGNWSTQFAASTNPAWIKYTFPTKAVREIELYFCADQTICGFNVGAGDTISTSPQTLPVLGIFGDSYIETYYSATSAGTASTNFPTNGFPIKLREALGIIDMRMMGKGGQGVVKAVSTKTFVDRANAGEFGTKNPSLSALILYNSINDYDQTVATVAANWQTVVSKAMTDYPDAIIWGFTGFKNSGYNVDSAHNAAFINAFNAVKDSRRMGVWDGDNQIVTIGGNDSTWVASDGIHLTDTGNAGAAAIVAAQFTSFLQTL